MLSGKAYVNSVLGRHCHLNVTLISVVCVCVNIVNAKLASENHTKNFPMKTQEFPKLPGRLPGSAVARVSVPIHLSSSDRPLNHHSYRGVTAVWPEQAVL